MKCNQTEERSLANTHTVTRMSLRNTVCPEQKTPDTKEHTLWDLIFMEFQSRWKADRWLLGDKVGRRTICRGARRNLWEGGNRYFSKSDGGGDTGVYAFVKTHAIGFADT